MKADGSNPFSAQKNEIMAILRELVDPETLDDIVTAGYVQKVEVEKATSDNTMNAGKNAV